MAFFKRFASRRRFGGFPKRRRRPALATSARRLQMPRWQWGNFILRQTCVFDNADAPDSVQFFTNTLSPYLTFTPGVAAIDLTLQRNVRGLKIGGMVWTEYVIPRDILIANSAVSRQYDWQSLLWVDKVDLNGAPVSLQYPWFTNTTPWGTIAAATLEDSDAPTRILDRHAGVWSPETGATGDALYAQQNVTAMLPRTRSKRLRLFLLPSHALAFHFTVQFRGAAALAVGDGVSLERTIVGSIYYQYVF